jgi:hypothetical protein
MMGVRSKERCWSRLPEYFSGEYEVAVGPFAALGIPCGSVVVWDGARSASAAGGAIVRG